MKNAKTLILLSISCSLGQAAVVTWGGAGSPSGPEFWNLPVNGNPGRNDDPTHWNQATPPVLDGTDDAVLNGGGVQKNDGLDFTGGSTMTLNSGAYFRRNPTNSFGFNITGGSGLLINDGVFEANVNFTTVSGASSFLEVVSGAYVFNSQSTSAIGLNAGATAIVRAGGTIQSSTFFNSQNSVSATVGGTFLIDGGTLLASGPQADPIRASNGLDGGGFDFTGLGGAIQLADFTGGDLTAYLQGKASSGFFKIDGTTVPGFGAAHSVSDRYLELTDNGGAGSLVLVPEPSVALLGGLGLLGLLRRRR